MQTKLFMDEIMGKLILKLTGVVLVIIVVVTFAVYRNHAEKQRLYDYNASVIRYLPKIPYEKGRELSAEEKQASLDMSVLDNRIFVAAGLASDYEKENFIAAYFPTVHPKLEPVKDEFQKRELAQVAILEGSAGFAKARDQFAKKPPQLLDLPVELRFRRYDFDAQAFVVTASSPIQRSVQGGFFVEVLRNIGDPSLVLGKGNSTFERAASGTRAYRLTERLWPVPEVMAKNINMKAFTLYARTYFDTSKSRSDGKKILLYCTQLDTFSDPEMTNPQGSQGCGSLNITMKLF